MPPKKPPPEVVPPRTSFGLSHLHLPLPAVLPKLSVESFQVASQLESAWESPSVHECVLLGRQPPQHIAYVLVFRLQHPYRIGQRIYVLALPDGLMVKKPISQIFELPKPIHHPRCRKAWARSGKRRPESMLIPDKARLRRGIAVLGIEHVHPESERKPTHDVVRNYSSVHHVPGSTGLGGGHGVLRALEVRKRFVPSGREAFADRGVDAVAKRHLDHAKWDVEMLTDVVQQVLRPHGVQRAPTVQPCSVGRESIRRNSGDDVCKIQRHK